MPDGKVREFSGDEIDLIADAEGITGIISELTMEVMSLEDMKVVSIAFDSSTGLQEFSELLINEDVPIWSMLFINPKMAELKNKAPLMEHDGHSVEERVILPEAYIVTLTYCISDEKTVQDKLPNIVKDTSGSFLSDEIAEREWKNRFKLMIVKRLGPSLVPAEVIVPLDNLGEALSEIETKIQQPLVKEGVVIKNGRNGKAEVVLLGFIPSDQRKFSYNFVFSLTLSIIKIAEKFGGRPYATGMYFSGMAEKVLGKDRLEKIKTLKKEVDPAGILNPNKVISRNAIGSFMGLASFFEPLIRPFGNMVAHEISDSHMKKDIKGIPGDVAWYAYACSNADTAWVNVITILRPGLGKPESKRKMVLAQEIS